MSTIIHKKHKYGVFGLNKSKIQSNIRDIYVIPIEIMTTKKTQHEQVNSISVTEELPKISAQELIVKYQVLDNFSFPKDITYAPSRVPLSVISHDLKNFQNRKTPYSESSVNNIIDAVLQWTFDLRIFNPIILWRDKDKNSFYILWWHSRFEAFKRLSEYYRDNEQVKAFCNKNNWNFSSILWLILDDINFEDAKTIALISNALATIETDVERAEIYRAFRELGKNKKYIIDFWRKCEKSNRPRIFAYSYLNPNGSISHLLDSFEKSEDDWNVVKRIAVWVWNLRKKYPDLTDAHERELYVRLFEKQGYWTQKWQINSQSVFFDVVERHLNSLSRTDWNINKPLNILKVQELTYAEQQFYLLKKKLQNRKKELLSGMHKNRRNLNKQISLVSERTETELLKKQLTEKLWLSTNVFNNIDNIDDTLFVLKDIISVKNIKIIEETLRDSFNSIEQQYYKHMKNKEKYLSAGKQELLLNFEDNKLP